MKKKVLNIALPLPAEMVEALTEEQQTELQKTVGEGAYDAARRFFSWRHAEDRVAEQVTQ